MDIKWFFAGVAVADYTSALAWYERLMGRPPDFNPHETEAVWRIIDNGWIYVVADTDRERNKISFGQALSPGND